MRSAPENSMDTPARDRQHRLQGSAVAMTLDECAEALGISRQRVAQIEREALGKIRAALAARGAQAWHFLDVPDRGAGR
jgi:DNA-directed RNA polymerase sigma subunit (sigma70/sigma32)